MRVNFAQSIEQAQEQAAHETLSKVLFVGADMKIQRPPTHVSHNQINRFVGAKKVFDAHDVRMIDLREGAPFLKKAFHAMTKGR